MPSFTFYDTPAQGIAQQMTPRQLTLNRLWAWFRCVQYDGRKMDWNGTERLEALDHEVVETTGYIPDGFQVITDSDKLPLKFRRPTAPYNLPKVVIERFTAMLFSTRRHPEFVSATEPDTQEWMAAVATTGRLWPAMVLARNYGGAMGSTALGFSFTNGVPRFEAHDPRWCFVEFGADAEEVVRLEKKYPYTREEFVAKNGRYEPVMYWYRRVIDTKADVVYAPMPDTVLREAVEKKQPIPWRVAKEVVHGFDFCPVEWVQNLAIEDDLDGEPDCAGIYDTSETIDALYSQANAGTLANCDPTLLLKSDSDLGDIALGSKNVVKVNQGDDGKFLEIQATGIKAARELAEEFKQNALEVVSCVLDGSDVGDRATATEVERKYSAMLTKCDLFREQYGKALICLMQKVIRAVRRMEQPRTVEYPAADGSGTTTVVEKMVVKLPPKVIVDETGNHQVVEQKLGLGEHVALKWPAYFNPSLSDTKLGADAVASARTAGALDTETAVRFLSPYFGSPEPRVVMENLAREKEEAREEEEERQRAEMLAKLAKPPKSDNE